MFGTLLCVPNTGLNQGLTQKLNELAIFLVTEEGKNFKIVVEGNTSAANPTSGFNTKLATDRANNTKEYLFNLMVAAEGGVPPKLTGTEKEYPLDLNMKQSSDRWETKQKGQETAALKCLPSNSTNGDCNDGNPCIDLEAGQANSKTAKLERFASITLESNTILQSNLINETNNDAKASFDLQQKEAQQKADAAKLAAKFYVNECDYFMEMKRTDPFIYNSLGEKIKNFHPAFHAITPEGFNSRITFLQQCMRQGPQLIDPNAPQNMVFGRPPVCVLKIGDFYHTKIVIDNCNFTFDPLQWDLNPEGIGVQPMIVKVDLSFKFIGGSSLGGPIKQLQNAVSYNFFANTGVYRPASVLGKAMTDRQAFIYGSFITPEEADSKYQEVQDLNTAKTTAAKKAAENTTPATNPDTVTAEANGSLLSEVEVVTDRDIPPPASVPTQALVNPNPATPPSSGPSRGGTMVYNQDGSVNITDINSTFPNDFTSQVTVPVQILNKTSSPLSISKIFGESTNSGVFEGGDPRVIEPNGLFNFDLVPELEPGVTQDSILRVTSTSGTHQLRMILKPA